MFTKANPEGYLEKLKGVMLKTLAYGENTLITNVKISKGASIPKHNHVHEQTGFLITGLLEFTIDGDIILARTGDSWTILKNIPHGAFAVEDCDLVEVFSPIREDYLP
jgi:quercetin dioxygenase-like cupin family protein